METLALCSEMGWGGSMGCWSGLGPQLHPPLQPQQTLSLLFLENVLSPQGLCMCPPHPPRIQLSRDFSFPSFGKLPCFLARNTGLAPPSYPPQAPLLPAPWEALAVHTCPGHTPPTVVFVKCKQTSETVQVWFQTPEIKQIPQ